jgi:poly-beta-1,6-N-acetyl-D-glucosamine synthase
MNKAALAYAAVSPVRNEADNLRRLCRCLSQQTVAPSAWIVVDNGSDDDTPDVMRELSRTHPWIRTLRVPGEDAARPGAPVVRAFHAGLVALDQVPEVVVKLDADVSVDRDYFERLLDAFAANETLGIASGVCYEQHNGEWRPTHVTGHHVRGASRAYRWRCLQDLLPLEERMGWDGIDELKAHVLGWKTQIVSDLRFYHHRSVGARDGARHKRWHAQGHGAHYMGYRFWYLVLRTLHHALRDPAALAMLWGYAEAALRGERLYHDATVRAHLRRQQSLRNVPARAREALGRRAY